MPEFRCAQSVDEIDDAIFQSAGCELVNHMEHQRSAFAAGLASFHLPDAINGCDDAQSGPYTSAYRTTLRVQLRSFSTNRLAVVRTRGHSSRRPSTESMVRANAVASPAGNRNPVSPS